MGKEDKISKRKNGRKKVDSNGCHSPGRYCM